MDLSRDHFSGEEMVVKGDRKGASEPTVLAEGAETSFRRDGNDEGVV
jgi:hypothetical protein